MGLLHPCSSLICKLVQDISPPGSPGCAGGDRETPPAPTGDAAIGNSVVQSHFPTASLSLLGPQSILHVATATKLLLPRELDCFFPFPFQYKLKFGRS